MQFEHWQHGRCFLTTLFPVCDEPGHVNRIAVLGVDITNRIETEKALRRKTEELDRFFSLALDMLCISDTDGNFIRLNPAWEKTLGYELEEFEGRQYFDFIHPDDIADSRAILSKIACVQEVHSHINRYRCKDGTYRWIEWRSSPYMGRLIYAAARDITDIKRANETLTHTLTELERSNKELERFAYVASHDLQEPLRTISSYVQLLERRYSDRFDQDGHEFMQFIVDATARMKRLINDLLDFSRMQRKGKPLMTIDSSRPMEQALANLKPSMEECGAVITCDLLPMLYADEGQLAIVFQNLIGNALKFRGKDAPEIHIGVEENEEGWIFSIRDNGIGIESTYLDRIFIIFQRLHSQGEYPGTGIGLAMVKKIIERHNGKIWVQSEPGKGSTFFFMIPRKGAHHR